MGMSRVQSFASALIDAAFRAESESATTPDRGNAADGPIIPWIGM
jgi:hypothetical protein